MKILVAILLFLLGISMEIELCAAKSACSKGTKSPCKDLMGTCIKRDDFCNGYVITNNAFCRKGKKCKCCFPACDCLDQATCTYKHIDGLCSRLWLPDTINVGPQDCTNGCECYIPDIIPVNITEPLTTLDPTHPPTTSSADDCPCGEANTRRRGGSSTRGSPTTGKPNRERQSRRIPSKPTRGSPSEQTRIRGGKEVQPPRRYPWQVSVQVNREHNCGGSIINNRWILTAGHCLLGRSLQVIVGEHILYSKNDDDPVNTKKYWVSTSKQILHPEYKKHINGQAEYDFALLELSKEIPLNSVIRPVCLPKDDSKTYSGVNATVSGWGRTTENGPVSDTLLETDVPIEAQSDCIGWGTLPGSRPVTEIELCAGPVSPPSPGNDACKGDSGGPLVVKEGNKYIQVGVVSYGGFCGIRHELSGVYARVSKVLDWIRETTASGKC